MRRKVEAWLVAIAFVAVLMAEALRNRYLWLPILISDENYYVPAGLVLAKTLVPILKIPVPLVPYNVTVANDTVVITVNMSGRAAAYVPLVPGVAVLFTAGHPGLAQLIYGLVVGAAGNVVVLRLVLLSFSALAYALFVESMMESGVDAKYLAVGLGLLLAFGNLAVLLTFLAYLDTLAMVFTLLSLAMHFRGKELHAITFSALAAAAKEFFVVVPLAYLLYFLSVKSWRRATEVVGASVAALILSYAINLLAVRPSLILADLFGMVSVGYASACGVPLCLLGLRASWGVMTLYTPLVWVWVPALLLWMRVQGSASDVFSVPTYLALLTIALSVTLGAIRVIYPYYYLIPVSLSPVAVYEVIVAAKSLILGPGGRGFRVQLGSRSDP